MNGIRAFLKNIEFRTLGHFLTKSSSFFRGKIKYFTCPPESFSPTTHLAATIVADMAKEFSLDDADFTQKESMDIDQLPSVRPSATVSVETMGFFEGNTELNINDSAMECDNDTKELNGKTDVVSSET